MTWAEVTITYRLRHLVALQVFGALALVEHWCPLLPARVRRRCRLRLGRMIWERKRKALGVEVRVLRPWEADDVELAASRNWADPGSWVPEVPKACPVRWLTCLKDCPLQRD